MRFVFTLVLIQVVSSALWAVGFVLAFLGMELHFPISLWAGSIVWTLQNILMFPAYLWTVYALPGSIVFPLTRPADLSVISGIMYGVLSPFPSLPTAIWSLFLACIATFFNRTFGKQKYS